MQNEIQLLAGAAAGVGKQALGIGAAQARGLCEQIDFVIAPIGIEVAGDDHGLGGFAHQVIEVAQLILAVPELQGQMHQEYRDVIEFQFDDEPLDAGVEIMETLAANPGRRQKCVGLLAHDRHQVIDRRDAILALIGRVVAQGARNEIRLIDHSGADGARYRPR